MGEARCGYHEEDRRGEMKSVVVRGKKGNGGELRGRVKRIRLTGFED
jgi:hypothetical protein